jgi:hypothetical protein
MTFDEWYQTPPTQEECDHPIIAAWNAALEEAAKMLDAEHEARKHIDNHAAFYALKIRALKGIKP